MAHPAAGQLLDQGRGEGSVAVGRVHGPETLEAVSLQSGIVDPHEPFEQLSSPEEVIEATVRLGGAFLAPGQRTEYRNVNYLILGEIISKVSGKDTGDQIAQSILRPLGLKNTIYPTNNDLPGDLHGYSYDFSSGDLKDTTRACYELG